MEFIKSKDIPKDAHVTKYMRSKAKFFIGIMLFGITYYIPVTENIKRILGIKVVKATPVITEGKALELEKFIRDIVACVLNQVSDTVGSEVYSNLSNEIKEYFERFYTKKLAFKIDSEMKKRIPFTRG